MKIDKEQMELNRAGEVIREEAVRLVKKIDGLVAHCDYIDKSNFSLSKKYLMYDVTQRELRATRRLLRQKREQVEIIMAKKEEALAKVLQALKKLQDELGADDSPN